MKQIRTVVIPVAGLGTRVLPATKSIPKEMLPVVDRPLIDYVIDEARDAGIERFVLVTGRGKSAIEDYFDHAFELETSLRAKGKAELLAAVEATAAAPGAVSYTRQQAPRGLGHAVWCARAIVGDEPFAVSLPDEIVPHRPGFLRQLVEAHAEVGGNIVAVEETPLSEVSKYGIVAPAGNPSGTLIPMNGMVEKPKPDEAPSRLRIIGRYVLQPEIFEVLADQEAGAGGEIQLTDAMNRLLQRQAFHACLCRGLIHDCGSKLGWLQANIDLGLKSPEFAEDLRAYLRGRLE